MLPGFSDTKKASTSLSYANWRELALGWKKKLFVNHHWQAWQPHFILLSSNMHSTDAFTIKLSNLILHERFQR